MEFFLQGQSVYPLELEKEVNTSLLFVFDFEKKNDLTLTISGNSSYQVYLNGRFIHYGPFRASNNYFRVTSLPLANLEKNNRIIVILNGYNCNSFNHPYSRPFLCLEIKNKKEVVCCTSALTKAYRYINKYRKVTRFSYQREFSESYHFDSTPEFYFYNVKIPYFQYNVSIQEKKNFLPTYNALPYLELIDFNPFEKGKVEVDENIKPYEDRYMVLDQLIIFDKNNLDVDPNKIVSKFKYVSHSSSQSKFITYKIENEKTGFINIRLNVVKDAQIYVIFDEIDTKENKKDFTKISFYRNTTHNILSYELNEGSYNLTSLEPYSAKYIRVIVYSGEVRDIKVKMFLYENPLCHRLKFTSNNKKINKVIEAGIATLAQNSVDILTDCPSRERAGWLCDSYFSSRSEYLITGSNKAEKTFLENYALYQELDTLPHNMIPMCYPGDFPDGTYIPNWSLFYILELENYFNKYKDEELKKLSLIKVRGILDFFTKYENEYGLLENLENWVFVEWSKENDEESIKGVNFPSNMLYYASLLTASKLLKDPSLLKKANKLKKNIEKFSFNGQFYVDNATRDDFNNLKPTSRIGETTQYYAFYFKIADKTQHLDLFNLLVNKFGPHRNIDLTYPEVYPSNVFIGDYLRLEILLNERLDNLVKKETIAYFYNMACQTGTLWEHDSPFASLNHAFASFIVNIIVTLLTGVVSIDEKKKIIYQRKVKVSSQFKLELPVNKDTIGVYTLDNKIQFILPQGYKVKELNYEPNYRRRKVN